MRKILMVLLLVLTCGEAYAQKFMALPTGVRDADNIDNSFLVLSFPDKTPKELYEATNKFIQMSYVNPNNAIRGNIEGKYIKVTTYASNAILLQKGVFGEPYYADLRLLLSFEFREGRMKFDIEQINFLYNKSESFDYIRVAALSWGIFDKKGMPVKDFNVQLENYLNTYVNSLISFINKEFTVDDDW